MPNLLRKFSVYLHDRHRGLMLALLAAVGLVYLPFLGNPFVFDDANVLSGPFTNYYSQYGFIFDFRWFPYASIGWTTRLFSDLFPQPYRVGNLLLHAANVIILFHLLRELLGAVIRDPGSSSRINWGAWFGALMFAVHPVAVYAAGYVAQRSILMATLFALLTQWAYLRALLTGQARWLVLTVAAFFLACFSKEHSIMLPVILLAMTWIFHNAQQANRRALWLTWSALALIGLLVVLRAKGVFGTQVFGSAYEVMAADMFEQQKIVESGLMLYLLSVLTQAGLFFKYLLLWLVPNISWMSVDMRETFVPSIYAWQGWLGALGFLAYGLVALRLLLRGGVSGLAGLALLYPWVMFITEFSSVRVQEPLVLYRSYLWMPLAMLFIPLLLVRFPQRRVFAILGGVTILLVALAWNRLWVFADNYRLWNEAATQLRSPQESGANRIYYNRGLAHLAAKRWDDAIGDFELVMAISPKLAPVRYNLGLAYANAGRYQDALDQFDAAIALKNDDAAAFFVKGFTLKRLGREKEAMEQMKKSCELHNTTACLIVSMKQQMTK